MSAGSGHPYLDALVDDLVEGSDRTRARYALDVFLSELLTTLKSVESSDKRGLEARVVLLEEVLTPIRDYAADRLAAGALTGEVGEVYVDGVRRALKASTLLAVLGAMPKAPEEVLPREGAPF